MDVSALSTTKQLSDIDTLARNRLLRGLSMQELGALLDVLDQVALPHGSTIMSEGEQGPYAYIVLEGTARECRGAIELRDDRSGRSLRRDGARGDSIAGRRPSRPSPPSASRASRARAS